MIFAEPRIKNAVLPDLAASIPCEMADPVEYSADGHSIESFHPCMSAAEWRLVLSWHHGPTQPDEHLVCDRHLGVWLAFRDVEHPPWKIGLLAKL